MRRFSIVLAVTAALVATGPMGASVLAAPGQGQPGIAGWTIQPSPNPVGASTASLEGVSCASDGTCMAVGHSMTSSGPTLALAERFDGTAWSIVAIPSVAGANDSILTNISCPLPSACMAVGYWVNPHGSGALIEQWNGQAWKIDAYPPPAHSSYSSLGAVSCSAANACLAVGGFITQSITAQLQPWALHWDGTAWTNVPVPNPHAENGADLSAVFCTAAATCIADANYAFGDVDQTVYALGWNGATWTRQPQPNPKGGQVSNTDTSLACWSATGCLSVGTWLDNNGANRSFSELWNGIAWTLKVIANPAGAVQVELFGVSCEGPTSCTAVGDRSPNANGTPSATLADHWDGTVWRAQTTPNQAGATYNKLSAVDCSGPHLCVAVGSSYASGVTQTLIEVRSR